MAKVAMKKRSQGSGVNKIKYIQYFQAPPNFNTLKNKNILKMDSIEKICEIEFEINYL